ncbi:hypothetical protein KI387_031374, partial [Taxus chinensis]
IQVLRDLTGKLDEKQIEAVDGLNDISEEFKNIHCNFLSQTVIVLLVDQIIESFKGL